MMVGIRNKDLPARRYFDRGGAYLTIVGMDPRNPRVQMQLLGFLYLVDAEDEQLLFAIIEKLDPAMDDCRAALTELATEHPNWAVAKRSLNRLNLLESWRLRLVSYKQIAYYRETQDFVWELAVEALQELANIVPIEHYRT